MTRTLIPSSALTSSTHFADARRLAADVEALGGAIPARLRNLLDVRDVLTKPVPTPNTLSAIVAAAADGTLSEKKLATLVDGAARAHAVEQYRRDLARNADRELLQQFSRELLDGAADEILDSVRPVFDENAAIIADGLQLVNLDQSYRSFIESADPDALGAYQRLKPATATIAQIVALAVQFGPRSISFPLIVRPVEGIGHEEFWLYNEAIFTATGEGVRSASIYMREHARKVESLQTIKPQDLGMRFSPWLQTGLRLNSIGEAREAVRLWAEQTVENTITPGLVGRYANPYKTRAEEPGDVEILGADGSIEAVV